MLGEITFQLNFRHRFPFSCLFFIVLGLKLKTHSKFKCGSSIFGQFWGDYLFVFVFFYVQSHSTFWKLLNYSCSALRDECPLEENGGFKKQKQIEHNFFNTQKTLLTFRMLLFHPKKVSSSFKPNIHDVKPLSPNIIRITSSCKKMICIPLWTVNFDKEA